MQTRTIIGGCLAVVTVALIPVVYHQYNNLKRELKHRISREKIKAHMEGWTSGYNEGKNDPVRKQEYFEEFKKAYAIK